VRASCRSGVSQLQKQASAQGRKGWRHPSTPVETHKSLTLYTHVTVWFSCIVVLQLLHCLAWNACVGVCVWQGLRCPTCIDTRTVPSCGACAAS
jgi:hypothetical protein